MTNKKKLKVVTINRDMEYIEMNKIFPSNNYLKSKIDLKELINYMKDFDIETLEIVMNADLSNFDNIKVIDEYIDNMELF